LVIRAEYEGDAGRINLNPMECFWSHAIKRPKLPLKSFKSGSQLLVITELSMGQIAYQHEIVLYRM
jgi:hypothetical protein